MLTIPPVQNLHSSFLLFLVLFVDCPVVSKPGSVQNIFRWWQAGSFNTSGNCTSSASIDGFQFGHRVQEEDWNCRWPLQISPLIETSPTSHPLWLGNDQGPVPDPFSWTPSLVQGGFVRYQTYWWDPRQFELRVIDRDSSFKCKCAAQVLGKKISCWTQCRHFVNPLRSPFFPSLPSTDTIT